jgi:hypothetical protein
MNIYLIGGIAGLVLLFGGMFCFAWKMMGFKDAIIGFVITLAIVIFVALISGALAQGLFIAGLVH